MKNAILAITTLCSIFMIIAINKGMDTLNQAQEGSVEEVNEWMNEIAEKDENLLAAQEAKWNPGGTSAERMRELSRKQESIHTEMTQEFMTAFESKSLSTPAADGQTMSYTDAITLYDALIRRQKDIIDEFSFLLYDLSEQLDGIADYRHIQALDNMRESDAFTHLDNIKTMLLRRQLPKAAESSKIWAGKMSGWATALEAN